MIDDEIRAGLGHVRECIASGWEKLHDDGTKSIVGVKPAFDIYRAVLAAVGRRFRADVLFDVLARTILDRHPDRVQTEFVSAYDARIITMEFNDHPDTSHLDVLHVIATC